ncbi:tyrosine-type recombinase/integrase [Heyndrickxia sp. NPDC080065]|uniref:tyrosine-type recombinase/integrase n=1 Tax=Heyndrickxia sp. NPDC080065 TaxID=3390568 RepID=UPI003D02488F
MIINAEIINQPYSGRYKERIYDVLSPWNSQSWTWVKFENEDFSEWCGEFRGLPWAVALSKKYNNVLVLTSDYLFKIDCVSGEITEYESQPQYHSLTVSPLGDFVITDYYDIEIIKSTLVDENKLSAQQKVYFFRDKERDIAILSLFLGSGIRVNELSNLRLRNLDFEEKTISVLRKGGKLDTIPVVPESMDDLKKYLTIRSTRYHATKEDFDYVFVKKSNNIAYPISNRAIEDMVKKYTKAFKSNKSMSPHKLRHTYVTNLMEQENDIHLLMRQLGHTSTTTAALYSNPEQEKAKQAAIKMGNRREQSNNTPFHS